MPQTITVYTFNELQGEAREHALRRLPEPDCDNTLDECLDSLSALCKLAGVELKDWSIGPYAYSYVKVEFPNSPGWDRDDALGDLAGPRAVAWIENNILGPLRHPWTPATVPPSAEWSRVHGKYSRRYSRPGAVPDCPLTGVCFDEDLLDVFRGRDMESTLKERFESLADVIRRICEADLEYQEKEGREERAGVYFEGALFDEHGNKLRN